VEKTLCLYHKKLSLPEELSAVKSPCRGCKSRKMQLFEKFVVKSGGLWGILCNFEAEIHF